jgi:hypothetical protein
MLSLRPERRAGEAKANNAFGSKAFPRQTTNLLLSLGEGFSNFTIADQV